VNSTSFDELVSQSVIETMSKILGSETWKAINFFFDVKTIVREPETFAALLDKVFGYTSIVLQKKNRRDAPRQSRSNTAGIEQLRLSPDAQACKSQVPTTVAT